MAASPQAASAQKPPRPWHRLPAPALADTSLAAPLPATAATPPLVRRPAAARLRELRGQRDFQYPDAAPAPAATNSWWQRLLGWLLRQLAGQQETKGGHVIWNIVFYGLLGAVLLFAVLKLLQVDLTRAFGRAPRRLPLAYETGPENIHELNFADGIAQAEAAGNLRLALRLGYLHLLKQLTDRDLIDWQPDKTNQAYLHELAASQPTAHAAFAALTRQFEYSWYGELPVSTARYQQVRADQHRLAQQLSGGRVAAAT